MSPEELAKRLFHLHGEGVTDLLHDQMHGSMPKLSAPVHSEDSSERNRVVRGSHEEDGVTLRCSTAASLEQPMDTKSAGLVLQLVSIELERLLMADLERYGGQR